MQRKPTKNTRGPNSAEKRFMAFTKESSCICCGHLPPSIVHHAMGATYKHNKTLVGHWFILPLCEGCNSVVTRGNRRKFVEIFGPQNILWFLHLQNYSDSCPANIIEAIMDCNE